MSDYFIPDLKNFERKQMDRTGDGFAMAYWAGGVIEPIGHTKMLHDFDAGPASMLTCLECHDTDELAEATAELKPTNPLKNRHYDTGADCNLCHHQHRASVNFCLPCHVRFDFDVP